MVKKYWPGVLIGVILLTAALIRIQEYIAKQPEEKVVINNNSISETTVSQNQGISTTTQNDMGSAATTTQERVNRPSPSAMVDFGNFEISVMLANTPETRFQGLSGKQDLGEYGGMLFVFDQSSYYTMVMRDMLFPLDFIWIDGSTIVDIGENAVAERGIPENQLTRYTNGSPANMVLEVPAGFTSKNAIKVGDKVEIKI